MNITIPAHVRAMYADQQQHRAELERLPSVIDGLRLRRVLHDRTGVDFLPGKRYFTGWWLDSRAGAPDAKADTRVLVSCAPQDGADWVHASISHPDRMPTYEELTALHDAAFIGYAHQVFAPPSDHVNIHPFALHLWGRLDGGRVLPDFGRGGTI